MWARLVVVSEIEGGEAFPRPRLGGGGVTLRQNKRKTTNSVQHNRRRPGPVPSDRGLARESAAAAAGARARTAAEASSRASRYFFTAA